MNTEQQIEFDKVKAIWSELAVTAKARQQIAGTGFFLDEMILRREMRETTDGRELIEKLGEPPLQEVSEILEILDMARKGVCLTPYQLERVQGVLIIVERLQSYLARGKQYQNPIAYYDETLDSRSELRDQICLQIRAEAVDDHASRTLFDIRTQIVRCEEQMKQKAEQTMRSYKECMADSFYTTRNGRICVPVKKEYRFRVEGTVVDRSSTGSTVFIEPAGVAKIWEQLQLLKVDEENEEYRILYTLSAMVADSADIMEEDMRLIEKLDFIFSKGKLSIDLDCTEPRINLERRIVLKDARHPLMNPKENVPLNFELGMGNRGVVITGPNTGGKTVAIKTVMLNSLMAQCGLHVTCREADICMNDAYLCDIGDGQDLSENLSTFSAHIMNVLEILKTVDKDSFVIMDELGSGTDPTEGMGIAIAILEELRKSGANFLVTTHYPEVKEYARTNPDIVNARMTFDKETLRPTYRMVIGEAGESCAFYIADRLGMPAQMLRVAAEAAYGTEEAAAYEFRHSGSLDKQNGSRIKKLKENRTGTRLEGKFKIGDSVMVMPDRKIGIVCEPVNGKGVLRVQIADRKIWINHKRVRLHVKAEELYPEDYDMSIVFDSVRDRKVRHDMSRKYTEETIVSGPEK